MIKIKIDVPTDVFIALQEQATKLPALVNKAIERQGANIRKRMLDELQKEPSKPKYPIRWKSERQRRAFFATNGFGGGIPYRRTGRLAANWKVRIVFDQAGGSISAVNDTPYANYVQGDDAQPMHLASGWPQAAPIFVRYSELLKDNLIETWHTVTDIYGGVKG